MPIYEYEPVDHDCLICEGHFEAIQPIEAASFVFCPTCGLECKRIVSRASFKMEKPSGADHAASRGFTTYKKVEKGVWEKIAGEGADVMAGTPEDIAAVEAEKSLPKQLDLDKGS